MIIINYNRNQKKKEKKKLVSVVRCIFFRRLYHITILFVILRELSDSLYAWPFFVRRLCHNTLFVILREIK